MPDLNKQNDRLNSVEGKLGNCIDSVEKLMKEQARMSAQLFQKGQLQVGLSPALALKSDRAGARDVKALNSQNVVFNHPGKSLASKLDVVGETKHKDLFS